MLVHLQAGVMGVRRVDKKDIKRIAKVTGAQALPVTSTSVVVGYGPLAPARCS